MALTPFLRTYPEFKVDVASLAGLRADNQDNYLLIQEGEEGLATARWLEQGEPRETQMAGWSKRWVRLAVLDGLGGHQHGREIAEEATLLLRDFPPGLSLEAQRRAVFEMHRRLQDRFLVGHAHSPATTLVWAEIDRRRHRCHLVHLGDSRAYLDAGSGWTQLTQDHTLTEFGWRDGRIDDIAYAAQRMAPGQRLAQALGYGRWGVHQDEYDRPVFGFMPEIRLDTAKMLPSQAADHADAKTLEIQPGALLLLASDGLWSGTASRDWPNPGPPCPGDALALAKTAVTTGADDNITLLLGGFPVEVMR